MPEVLTRLWLPPRHPLGFARLSAPAKLSLGILLALWIILVDHPLALGVPVAMLALVMLIEPLNTPQRFLFWGTGLLVMWATVLSQGFFYQRIPREALFTLIEATATFDGLRFYREGMQYGLVQSYRLLALIWMGMLIAFTTPLHNLLGGLQALRVPSGLGLMAVVAARSLPAIAGEALGVGQALRMRHLTLRRVGLSGVVRPILATTLRRSSTLAASLQVRGIDPADPRMGPIPRLSAPEIWLLTLASALVFAAAALRVLLWLYHQGWWYQPDWLEWYLFATRLNTPV